MPDDKSKGCGGTIRCDANASPVERVSAMEVAYDRSSGVAEALEEALDAFEGNMSNLEELSEYLGSGLWLKDFEADEAGLLPEGLKRGVLSEDGLYDLLAGCDGLRRRLMRLARKIRLTEK